MRCALTILLTLPMIVAAHGSASAAPTSPRIRNVVLVLADDLDWDLFTQVPRLAALRADGTTFTRMVVTDSLCCPSRSSILRSQFVHNHGVVTNVGTEQGGYEEFSRRGEQRDCLPTWLHAANIRTGLFGKYLNGFGHRQDPVPPGWDDFDVPLADPSEYRQRGYTLDDNGSLTTPPDFLGDLLTAKGTAFIRASGNRPFFAEIAQYSPHAPYAVGPAHRDDHGTAIVARTSAYNSPGTGAPAWRAGLPALSAAELRAADRVWTRRRHSAETVADTVDAVRATLRRTGHEQDTLVIVTSDNGFHDATRRLPAGKRTPYHEDAVVPMVMIGPGIAHGRVVSGLVSTIDLAPTVAALLGARVPAWTDGRSLVPLMTGTVPRWRTGLLTESRGVSRPGDPDYQSISPGAYEALRTQRWLYVEYATGERELYDLALDPEETVNVIGSEPAAVLDALHGQLVALEACSGASCRVADAR